MIVQAVGSLENQSLDGAGFLRMLQHFGACIDGRTCRRCPSSAPNLMPTLPSAISSTASLPGPGIVTIRLSLRVAKEVHDISPVWVRWSLTSVYDFRCATLCLEVHALHEGNEGSL